MRQTDRTILTNGRVHTPVGIADSLTFEAGRIVETGGQPSDAVPGSYGDGAKVIDLHGMTALPGFCLGFGDAGLVSRAASQPAESDFDGDHPSDEEISALLKAYAPKIAAMGVTEIWSDDTAMFGYDFRRMIDFFINSVSFEDLPFRLRADLKFQDVDSLNDFLSEGWRTGDGVPFFQIGAVTCGAGSEQDALIAMNAHMAGMQLCIAASSQEDDNVLTLLEQLHSQRNAGSRHLITRDGRRWENIMKKGVVLSARLGRNGVESPMSGIQAAVTGDDSDGRRMSVAEAISLYTWNAAWNGRNERRRGELAVGRDADIVILERDPFGVNVSEIGSIEVAMTICGGCVTYDAGKL